MFIFSLVAEGLFPEGGSGDDDKFSRFTFQFQAQFLDSNGDGDFVFGWIFHCEVGGDVESTDGPGGVGDLEWIDDGGLSDLPNDSSICPFHQDVQPVGVFAQVQCTAGKVGDFDLEDDRFEGEILFFVETDFHGDLCVSAEGPSE